MKKKMKRFEEGGYTGDDEIVKYRMGMTEKPSLKEDEIETETKQGQNKNIGDDVRARAMAAMANEPAPTPSKKAVGKAITKAVKEEKTEKPYIDIPKNSSMGMRQFRSDATSPVGRALSRFKENRGAATQTNPMGDTYKAGGKVSSASKRADGIAMKGKTRGKMC